ncbi:hypothetical protein PV341_07675 [Streptomyces sp. PA03-1a]|nr:hypothetical protein [Streptomyces sp. PA03-1a]
MLRPATWHASPRRAADPVSDPGTGEIRVPLSLFSVDEHQGDVDLVLSRVEGEGLLSTLRAALAASAEAVFRGPEVVR